MTTTTLAIPSETNEGLTGKRSGHFGHCPFFTLIDIANSQIIRSQTVENQPHSAGGCMQPVAMLAEKRVSAVIVAGMGRGPFQKMQQHGMTAYFADLEQYPDILSAVNNFIQDDLPNFGIGQLCTKSGTCHH